MNNTEWSKGSTKNRISRAIIANILIIPSWIFVIFLQKGSWIKDIGLNEFIVDSIHYFVLYFWLFGVMPLVIFKKALKLVEREVEDFYVVMDERK